ncbi:MAG: hypothetical protein FGM33_01550 [Candidatus Kapabacteria bacterium]|nr:hypothetical protein [Candidatus Kapabacteria bacterium]
MDQRQPRRPRVEIYFILYLLALVLLMPDGVVPSSDEVASRAPLRIELFPERIRLTCEVKRDSSGGVRVLGLDSTNVIRYSPELTNVSVRAVIEDVTSGQTLTIEPDGNSPTRFASIRHDEGRSAFVFSWRPLLDAAQSKTFRVIIQASGVPVNGIATDAMSAVGSTQFVLTTVVNDRQPPELVFIPGRRDTLVLREGPVTSEGASSPAEFWIEPARDQVLTFSSQEWSNRITIGGADPQRDLAEMPTVRLSGEPMSDVSRSIDQRTLIVRGRAPRSGTSTVEVTARRADGMVRTTSFRVMAMTYSTPSVPDVVYPGVEYVIDPKIPADRPGLRAVVRDGSREIASTTEGVMRVRFAIRDTGRSMTFERSIDGVVEMNAQSIQVRPFPPPVIREIRRETDPNKRLVVVQFWSQDRGENRPQIRVVDGNVGAVRKLSGYLRQADNARPAVAWLEVFEVTRKDASKPFTFRVVASDERGRESPAVGAD